MRMKPNKNSKKKTENWPRVGQQSDMVGNEEI